jgi:amino acid transporter
MDYITPLFRLSYWFSPFTVPFLPLVDKLVLIFMAALLIAGVACGVYAKYEKKLPKDTKKLLRRYSEALSTAGVSGLILYGFTWQMIPYLSMRFWYVVWFAVFGFWIWTIIRFQLKELPARKKMREEQAERAKWIPGKR